MVQTVVRAILGGRYSSSSRKHVRELPLYYSGFLYGALIGINNE